jgi:hypothetical protein
LRRMSAAAATAGMKSSSVSGMFQPRKLDSN